MPAEESKQEDAGLQRPIFTLSGTCFKLGLTFTVFNTTSLHLLTHVNKTCCFLLFAPELRPEHSGPVGILWIAETVARVIIQSVRLRCCQYFPLESQAEEKKM